VQLYNKLHIINYQKGIKIAEDLSKKITSKTIKVGSDVIITDLAASKAKELGINITKE
jgi:hypothetical protein